MNRFREYFVRLMMGRYGVDKLGRFLMGAALICIIAGIFIRNPLVDIIALILMGVSYFRMFSRNMGRRFQENQRFERFWFQILEMFRKWRFKIQRIRQYHIYKCPSCGQKIRIPRGKGKINIHCPKCNTEFIKRS